MTSRQRDTVKAIVDQREADRAHFATSLKPCNWDRRQVWFAERRRVDAGFVRMGNVAARLFATPLRSVDRTKASRAFLQLERAGIIERQASQRNEAAGPSGDRQRPTRLVKLTEAGERIAEQLRNPGA